MEAGADEFDFIGGEVVPQPDPLRRIALARLAETALLAPAELPAGMEGGLEHTAH